ncbi:MAG TPA: DUF2490 domain-containing protein [Pyrinomonadaceae bacterium]|nr:DUF2490 domain-containing protein [Pyrinomonadaceae bacterium]
MNNLPIRNLIGIFMLAVVFVGSARAQGTGYNYRGIPAAIEELDLGFPDKGKFTGQLDLQIVTQGAYLGVNNNPFAYWQRVHLRPWLQYHKSLKTVIATSISYKKGFEIPPTGVKESDEYRFTLMGTFTQPKHFGAIYEQVRGEVKNTRKSTGEWTHVPRIRFRLGQQFKLGDSKHNPKLQVYEEVMVKYQEHTKGLDIVRAFAGYGWRVSEKVGATIGFIVQAQLKSNGTDFDVYFGPSFTVRFNLGHSKHPPPPPDPDID